MMKPVFLANDIKESFTELRVTNLVNGRQHKHICYDYDELVYRRSQYTDSKKWHVEERGYVPCSATKMAL